MFDSDRRPTAQEIEELIDLVRRDPSSPAFVQLGDAYLALGRPRDAVQVGNLGLDAAPDNLGGRVMLARAFAAQHQWKEAQGELLRVVKVDRSNRLGFALLGEVLLRRNDYERAVPVLQHAQNLDPTSPQILSMLRRARAGQPLDAPPPLPTAVAPRGEDLAAAPRPRAPVPSRPHPPTTPPAPAPMPMGGPGLAPWPPPMVPTAGPAMSTMAIRMHGDGMAPPPAPPPLAALHDPQSFQQPPPPTRGPKQTAPPPMSVEGIRPRIVSGARPQNAAAASLRQSAAVGESYLNDLLTGGLLDVAGVRVPDAEFDLRPDRRWGRSTRRAFAFLFIVLVFGIGGGGTWYWWSAKQREEAISQLLRDAKLAIAPADPASFETSIEKLGKALDANDDSRLTLAYVAEAVGLDALLYGRDAKQGQDAVIKVGTDIKPGEAGARELVIGKASLALAGLFSEPNAVGSTLTTTTALLDEYLAKHEGDKWARWLRGRTLLAAGDRKGARGLFETAGQGEGGVSVALVDAADLLVDDGKLDEALVIYKQVTQQVKDHPLAVVGGALGKAEAQFEIDDTIAELNDKFVESKIPPRVAAYRNLALAFANLAIEDYPKARESIARATGGTSPREARFWSRVAWIHYVFGDLKATAEALSRAVAFGAKGSDFPTVQLVLAATSLATGLPEAALTVAAKLDGVRPRLLRTYALIDLGKYAEAQKEIDEVIAIAPTNIEAKILREQARSLGNEKERPEALEELERLARRANSKLGRHALGVTRLALGDAPGAKEQLALAINEITETSPNPVAYRTLTTLAEIEVKGGDLKKASEQLDKALGLNPAYFPSRALQAQIALRQKDPDKALQLLEPILKEGGAVTVAVQLTFAEVLVTRTGATAEDKAQARKIVVDLVGKAPDVDLYRVALAIDPTLPAELQLPDPSGAVAPTPAEASPVKKKAPPKQNKRR